MSQEEGHIADLFGVNVYAPALPQKKNFLPWHKPRKQFVRDAQWKEQIIKMFNHAMPENNVLKYLGLPGDDLLDLRYFHETICEPNNLQLKFLGFNYGANPGSQNSAELNISRDEVGKLPFIDPASDIIGDDICRLANIDSIAWSRSVKMGPFDVINIDLCDGFGKHPHDEFQETHYNTLSHLMTLQARRVNPWLLLLTTRTGKNHVNDEIFVRLKKLYGDNLQNCPQFLQSSTNRFSITNLDSLEDSALTEHGLSNIFLTALCKWIAGIAVGQNPPSKVEVKSVLGYKVDENAEHQDLVSLAIKIEPTLIPGHDKIGLVHHQHQPAPNECNIAAQALNRVAALKNVDQILLDDTKLMNEMISTSASLLEASRYDISNYTQWAMNQ